MPNHDEHDERDDHELNDQLRRAMAALDRALPAAFDTLAERTLARLDDASIGELPALQLVEPGEPSAQGAIAGRPARDEDSGLQDIRALASETKARLSSRRSSQDLLRAEDALASSSASWKSVALPEPARVVALPAVIAGAPGAASAAEAEARADGNADGADGADGIDELARERAARAAGRTAATAAGAAGAAPDRAIAARAASAGAATSARPVERRRVRLVASLGVAIAVAAGAVIVVSTPSSERAPPTMQRARSAEESSIASNAGPRAAPGAPSPRAGDRAVAVTTPPAAGSGDANLAGWQGQLAAGTMAKDDPDRARRLEVAAKAPVVAPAKPTSKSGKKFQDAGGDAMGDLVASAPPGGRVIGKIAGKGKPVSKDLGIDADPDLPATQTARPTAAGGKPAAPAGPSGASTGTAGGSPAGAAGSAPTGAGSGSAAKPGEAGEPSFDQLLQEAHIHDPKPAPRKLDRTALSGDDIKRGMTAVEPRAKACFAGTQGLAAVRLSVSPSGQVQKVTLSGPFAGTPVGACVERAVKAAVFPAWEGGPQSFGYSYLLSE